MTRHATTAPRTEQFIVDRFDYQRASHDVYNSKAVGLVAPQATASSTSPAARRGNCQSHASRGDGDGGNRGGDSGETGGAGAGARAFAVLPPLDIVYQHETVFVKYAMLLCISSIDIRFYYLTCITLRVHRSLDFPKLLFYFCCL